MLDYFIGNRFSFSIFGTIIGKIKIVYILVIYQAVLAQNKPSISQYINGIWQINKQPNFYIIFHNNKRYSYQEGTNNTVEYYWYYVFSKNKSYLEPYEVGGYKYIYKPLLPDSIYLDEEINFSEESKIVELIFYDKENIKGDTIFHNGSNFYQLFEKDKNALLSWSYNNSQRLVYYDRILKPSQSILNFYKKIAPEKFRKINSSHVALINLLLPQLKCIL